MKLELALRQIAEIHGHLDRSEMYRGYRSLSVWLTGVCALVATALQLRLFQPVTPLDFVWFWVGVAGVCGGIGAWGGAVTFCAGRIPSRGFARVGWWGSSCPASWPGVL